MTDKGEFDGPPTHLVYMTVRDQKEAVTICEEVVRERLAACANILPQVTSIYEWKGELVKEEECVVILKTQAARLSWLTDRLVELHSYDCPCVVSMPISGGNNAFLEWVRDQTRPLV